MKKYIAAENVQLVQSGDNYFNLLEEIINQSKITLHLQMYIFETDTTGLRIVNALKQAAARNVSIFILLDAFGSYSFSREIVQELLLRGIRFRFFSPLFSSESGYFGTDDKVCNEINKNEKKNNRMVQLKMWLFYTFYFLLMNIIVSKKRQRKLN